MRVLLAVSAFLYSTLIFASPQDKGFFRQVWLEDGLSQSSITAITQDNVGYMWFGTMDGLNRYDGKTVDQFDFNPFKDNTVSGDHISQLHCDKNGKLWILTSSSLDIMDLKTSKVTHISELPSFRGDKSKYIPYRIWVKEKYSYCFGKDGFERISQKGNSYSRVKIPLLHNDKKLIVYSIVDTPHGLFLGTNCGVFNFTKDSLKQINEVSPQEYANNLIWHNNYLYSSSKNKLNWSHPLTGKSGFILTGTGQGSEITSMLVDNRGKLWVGTNGAGLFRFYLETGIPVQDKQYTDEPGKRFSLRCNNISELYQGSTPEEDIVWIGTRDAGAVSYSYSKNSFTLYSSGISESANFFGTVKDKSGTIYSSTNTGLYIIEPSKKPVFLTIPQEGDGMMDRPIESIYCDDNNNVWLGTGNTLSMIKDKKIISVKEKVFDAKNPHIMKIASYDDSTLFIGTSHGPVLYSISQNRIFALPYTLAKKEMPFTSAGSFLKDSKGNTWIGTNSGLYKADKNNKLTHYKNDPEDDHSLLNNIVMDIRETAKGEILVATTKGLTMLIPSGADYKIENYYKPDGLLNNFLYSLLPDRQGNFWVSTNFGIACFNPEKRTFRSYHAADGIFINEFNSGGAYATADGELLFGGIGGLIGFLPENITHSKVHPAVTLRSVTINQEKIPFPAGQEFSILTHNKNNIQLEFSVIDFSEEGRARLLYKLNDDQHWLIVNGSNTISLANLAPGDYKLMVKASNRDGIETKNPVLLRFTIEPPFWKTWWFYSSVGFVFLIGAWTIYRINLKKKIRAIQERERIREEENEKLRKNAALDLHDEFGNGLTRISMLVEMAKLKVNGTNDAAKILDIISDNSSRLYQGTKDYIWSINTGNDNLYEVIIRIKDYGDELFYGRNMSFNISGLSDELKTLKQVPGTGRNVAMIFKEALSNIVKHSNATEVQLTVERNGSQVSLCLTDNGNGFDAGKAGSGFGLGNMKQRASRVSADFLVTSEQGKGSQIKVTLNEYR